MKAHAEETAPEDEILEGIIVEHSEGTEPEAVIVEEDSTVSSLKLPRSGFAQMDQEVRQERLTETLHGKADEINRGATEAISYKSESLEQTTANIARLQNLLKGIL